MNIRHNLLNIPGRSAVLLVVVVHRVWLTPIVAHRLCTPHRLYVCRIVLFSCFKSNGVKAPDTFDQDTVSKQLATSGLDSAIQMRRHGYVRMWVL